MVPGRPTLWEYYPRYVVILVYAQLANIWCVNVYMCIETLHCDGLWVLILVYFVVGSSNSSTRGACDWLHVWEGGVLCRHGLQECQLL